MRISLVLLCASALFADAYANSCNEFYKEPQTRRVRSLGVDIEMPVPFLLGINPLDRLPVYSQMQNETRDGKKIPASRANALLIEEENLAMMDLGHGRKKWRPTLREWTASWLNRLAQKLFGWGASREAAFSSSIDKTLENARVNQQLLFYAVRQQRARFLDAFYECLRAWHEYARAYVEIYNVMEDYRAGGYPRTMLMEAIVYNDQLVAQIHEVQQRKLRREALLQPVELTHDQRYLEAASELTDLLFQWERVKDDIAERCTEAEKRRLRTSRLPADQVDYQIVKRWLARNKYMDEFHASLAPYSVHFERTRLLEDRELEGNMNGFEGPVDVAAVDQVLHHVADHRVFWGDARVFGTTVRQFDEAQGLESWGSTPLQRYRTVRAMATHWNDLWTFRIRAVDEQVEYRYAVLNSIEAAKYVWGKYNASAVESNLKDWFGPYWDRAAQASRGVLRATETSGESTYTSTSTVASLEKLIAHIKGEQGSELTNEQLGQEFSAVKAYLRNIKMSKEPMDQKVYDILGSRSGMELANWIYERESNRSSRTGEDIPYDILVAEQIVHIHLEQRTTNRRAGREIGEQVIVWGGTIYTASQAIPGLRDWIIH